MYVDNDGNAAEAFAQSIDKIGYILGGLGVASGAGAVAGLLYLGFGYLVETVITGTQPLPHETPVTVEPPPAELVYPETAVKTETKVETSVSVKEKTKADRFSYNSPRIHHIVAQGAKSAKKSRDILYSVGIDPITDPRNLIVLPHGYHKSMHTEKYYKYVESYLLPFENKGVAVTLSLTILKVQIYAASLTGIAPWD